MSASAFKTEYESVVDEEATLNRFAEFVEGPEVTLVFTLFIIINTLVLAMDRYPISPKQQDDLDITNFVFALIFIFEMVLKIAALGDRNPSVGDAYNGMAAVYESQGKYEEALGEYAKALEIRRAALGDKHPDVGDTYYNMASVYRNCEKTAQARACYQSAAAVYEECYGPEHEETLDAQQQLRAL